MTKQSVVFSDAGALSNSSINMPITLTVTKSSMFPYISGKKKAFKKQQPVEGRKNARVDSMKASSPSHIKSPDSLSVADEDYCTWLVSVSLGGCVCVMKGFSSREKNFIIIHTAHVLKFGASYLLLLFSFC